MRPPEKPREKRDIVQLIIGWVIFIVGAIFFPLPIPIGLPMMIIGLAIIAPQSRFLQRWMYKKRKRNEGLNKKIIFARRYVPTFVQKFIDITVRKSIKKSRRHLTTNRVNEKPLTT